MRGLVNRVLFETNFMPISSHYTPCQENAEAIISSILKNIDKRKTESKQKISNRQRKRSRVYYTYRNYEEESRHGQIEIKLSISDFGRNCDLNEIKFGQGIY